MNRTDMEALASRLMDQVEAAGIAGVFDVEDRDALCELLRREARRRGIKVRTETAATDDRSVWVHPLA